MERMGVQARPLLLKPAQLVHPFLPLNGVGMLSTSTAACGHVLACPRPQPVSVGVTSDSLFVTRPSSDMLAGPHVHFTQTRWTT